MITVLCSFIAIFTSYEMTVSINSYFGLLSPLEEKNTKKRKKELHEKVSEIATN